MELTNNCTFNVITDISAIINSVVSLVNRVIIMYVYTYNKNTLFQLNVQRV